MDLYSELEWRGLVYDASEGVQEVLAREKVTAYIGFDPTASSLHVGSLLPILALARLRHFGHSVVALVGGGTGLIGDPSGKVGERSLLDHEQVKANAVAVKKQLGKILASASRRAERQGRTADSLLGAKKIVDNAKWLKKLTAVEFMRDVGKHFTVNSMLSKESVKRRLEGQEGISYTEFSYLLLQAYDFLELYDGYKATLQLGGSDQWGNITAGMDLIRRVRNAKAHGLVLPLVMTASGTKFGKTEAGTIWLDAELTGPYEFYQFWLNTADRDAVKYLKFFTYLPQERIAELEVATAREPERRLGQRELAQQVTGLVHGEAAVREAEAAAQTLFSGDIIRRGTLEQIKQVLSNVPSLTIAYAVSWPIVDLLADSGVTSSKGEATRLIRGGGIYVNDRRIRDEKERLNSTEAIDGQVFVVRRGKRDNFLIRIVRS